MDREPQKTAFDAAKETELYIRPPVPTQKEEAGERRARRQLIVVAVIAAVVIGGALGVIALYQALRPEGLAGRSLLEYDGLTYEKVEEAEDFAALGLSSPLTELDCGERVVELTEGEWKGSVLYRLDELPTRALLAVRREGETALYRFCYFTEPEGHSGEDVLAVITDGTALSGVDFYGKAGDWSTLLRQEGELAAFEAAFSALRPAADADGLRARMEQSDSWDAGITLRCENGLTFSLTVYRDLSVLAGFRTVYSLPDTLEGMIYPEEAVA